MVSTYNHRDNLTTTDILGVSITCMSYSIEYNEHHTLYENPSKYYVDDDTSHLDLSKPVLRLCIYPRTPVGFMLFCANSTEELREILLEAVTEINCINKDI